MKRVIKKNLVVIALVFTTLFSYANEGNIVSKDKVTNLTYDYVKKGSVLSIKDQNGLILFKEIIKEDGSYSKGFDLTSLPDGSYVFELDKEVEISLIPFKVSNNEVIFNKQEQMVINKPIVINKNNMIFLSKLSLEEQPMEVLIYYENGDMVLSEKLVDTQSISRVYNFNTSSKGEYKFVLKTDGRQFVEYVKI